MAGNCLGASMSSAPIRYAVALSLLISGTLAAQQLWTLTFEDDRVDHPPTGFTLAAMRANLEQVMTRDAYALTTPRAARLADALRALFARHRLPWCVTQIGARCEFQFCPTPPRTGAEAEAAMDHALERLLHLSLLNQGVLITPFHNMMLVCPDTPETAIAALVDGVEAVLEALRG